MTSEIQQERQQKLCFVVMPISEPRTRVRRRSNRILQQIIEPVAEELDYITERSDLIS